MLEATWSGTGGTEAPFSASSSSSRSSPPPSSRRLHLRTASTITATDASHSRPDDARDDAATPSRIRRVRRESPPCAPSRQAGDALPALGLMATSAQRELAAAQQSVKVACASVSSASVMTAAGAAVTDGLAEGSSTTLPYSPTSALLHLDSAHSSSSPTTNSLSPPFPTADTRLACSSATRIRQPELQASDFQHEEVLGEGSYSLVRLATHRKSGLLFALKEISLHRLRQLQLEPQLRYEINLQRTLRHPNIVRLYSYFVTSSSITLVLEYCKAGTLLRRVQAAPQGRLTEQQASRYARHIARALTHLHERGVAHRDLKLENVLVGEDGVAKLADFGWSRPMSASPTKEVGGGDRCCDPHEKQHDRGGDHSDAFADVEGDEKAEGRHTVCGTLDYLSPEMVSGNPHSFQTDVWSLGVMLAEMLTGAPPFYRDTAQQTLQAIRCEPPNLRCRREASCSRGYHDDRSAVHMVGEEEGEEEGEDAPPSLSAAARSLIEGMLEKDPALRPAMCDVLRHPWLQKPQRRS